MKQYMREQAILQRLMGSTFYNAMVAHDGFVAGGAVRSVFTSQPINDFDIFFSTLKDAQSCFESFCEGEESPTFMETDACWSHKGDGKCENVPEGMRFQLIKASVGQPEEIINRFDFTMCMAAWVPTVGFVLHDKFLLHCSQKLLCFNTKAEYPICSMWRALKFIGRKWKMPAIDAIKLALRIHDISIRNHGELKKQLMGIDTLFLKEFTDAIANGSQASYDYDQAILALEDHVNEQYNGEDE